MTLTSIMVMWWRNRQHKKTIKSIRNHMAFFGCDLSHLTDEEIEKGTIEFGRVAAKCGVTAKEALDGFKLLCSM